MQVSAQSIDEKFDALSEWVRAEFAKLRERYMEPPAFMIDSAKVKAIWDFALTRTQGEYAELCETWKNIDTKAQATIAAAGALVAVIATLVRKDGFDDQSGAAVALFIAVLLFGVSIVLCVWALWMRDVSMPITGSYLRNEVVKELEDNELQPSIDLDSRLVDLTAATQEQWVKVNEELHSKTNIKGERLRWAQTALASGLLVCLLLVVWYLYPIARGH